MACSSAYVWSCVEKLVLQFKHDLYSDSMKTVVGAIPSVALLLCASVIILAQRM